jgi:uncharacterized RDD family membrane protein YckC
MIGTFLSRLKAFLIDYLFILVYLILLLLCTLFIFPSLQTLFTGSLGMAQLMGFLLVTLPISLYFIVTDSVIFGQSFGKRKLGIQVVNRNGATLSVPQAIIRTFLKFLPWELSHFLVYRLVNIGDSEMPVHYYLIGGLIYALMLIYILTAIFTKKKQSLYDLFAKTKVIHTHTVK